MSSLEDGQEPVGQSHPTPSAGNAEPRPLITEACSNTLDTLRHTLVERGASYADIADNSKVFCDILRALGFSWPLTMTDTQVHCTAMEATKLARLASGDFQHLDSLLDMAGYAVLAHADTVRSKKEY